MGELKLPQEPLERQARLHRRGNLEGPLGAPARGDGTDGLRLPPQWPRLSHGERDLSNPSSLRNRSFKPLLTRVGLPDICLHGPRHTCATLPLSQGTHPKLIQELLGHATIALTLDTYSHFLQAQEIKP